MKKTNLNCVLFGMQKEVTFKFFVDNKMRSQYILNGNEPKKESLDIEVKESASRKHKRFMINKE